MRKMQFQDYWNNTEIHSFEELNNLAEAVITSLQYDYFTYDEDGNLIDVDSFPEGEYTKRVDDYFSNQEKNVLYFAENKELQKLSYMDAVNLTFDEIRERYLKDILPIARKIMREDPQRDFGYHVAKDISDDLLDNLLILRWKENLKLWTAQWEHEKNRKLDFAPVGIKENPRKDIPYYDPYTNLWKVEGDGWKEEGNLTYIAGEFSRSGLIYHFRTKSSGESIGMADHEHTFPAVIQALIEETGSFSIEGFEKEYSDQEIEFLNKIREKIKDIQRENTDEK